MTQVGERRGATSARQDLIGGLLSIAFGGFVLDHALGYPMGSVLRMGPGFFPAVLSSLIITLGVALTLHGFRVKIANPRASIKLRPIAAIAAAIAIFALTLERFGLAPATLALVVISSLGAPRWRPVRATVLAMIMTAAVYVVFIAILQMPFALFNW
jgi:putative tricarboxylic transport membrane protein